MREHQSKQIGLVSSARRGVVSGKSRQEGSVSESIDSPQTSVGTWWCDKRHQEKEIRTEKDKFSPEFRRPFGSMPIDLILR